MVISGDYLEVLEPDSRRLSVAQTENEQPERYEDYDWRTREALELLVLVHSVNNQAWAKLLLEKCALRFENEEDYFDANNDDDDGLPLTILKHSRWSASTSERCRCHPASNSVY